MAPVSPTVTDGSLIPAIRSGYLSQRPVRGHTHAIYRYPARFSPEFVRACLDEFTSPGDLVLDPFVGGGTAAVESLAKGRRFAGFDLNPLSILLTRAKTTHLGRRDRTILTGWLAQAFDTCSLLPAFDPRLRNAPADIASALASPVAMAGLLPEARQRDAARVVLLDVGQKAIDGRRRPASPETLKGAASDALLRLFSGLEDLRLAAAAVGIPPSHLPRRRVLRSVSAHDAACSRGVNRLVGRARLVVTSPPYPGVHVLYHRWQVGGRAETPMPYWLADLQDGLGPKHYTMGSRTNYGEDRYFEAMAETWAALRRLLHREVVIVQLVAFQDPARQLDRYLKMMAAAGYDHAVEMEPGEWRSVPNRRWYVRVRPTMGMDREILMVHRLSR
jgi:hypothetical protein